MLDAKVNKAPISGIVAQNLRWKAILGDDNLRKSSAVAEKSLYEDVFEEKML